MISKDKEYRTRDGREVRIYATDGDNDFPVHGAIKHPEGWSVFCWRADGKYTSIGQGSPDLIEVKPRIKRTVWLVHSPDGFTLTATTLAEAKALARNCSEPERCAIERHDVDCEEGEGL